MLGDTHTPRQLSGRRALVTGGRGFIGTRLCRELAAQGADVHATSRTAPSGSTDDTTWHACDLSNVNATQALFERVRPEFVFHLASHVTGARSIEAVLPTFHSNLTSTVNLLVAAKVVNCERVLIAGSMEEPEPGPSWAVPSSPYAAAKQAATAYGRMFDALFDLPVVILRVFMVYGPGQRDVTKLVPYVITSLLKGVQPRLGSGTREVDWIYVDDVVDAFVRAATVSSARSATIDVGSGQPVSVRKVVEHLFDIIRPGQTPEFGGIADRPMEQIRVADVPESLERIGWKPRVELLDGLGRTVEWYRRATA